MANDIVRVSVEVVADVNLDGRIVASVSVPVGPYVLEPYGRFCKQLEAKLRKEAERKLYPLLAAHPAAEADMDAPDETMPGNEEGPTDEA